MPRLRARSRSGPAARTGTAGRCGAPPRTSRARRRRRRRVTSADIVPMSAIQPVLSSTRAGRRHRQEEGEIDDDRVPPAIAQRRRTGRSCAISAETATTAHRAGETERERDERQFGEPVEHQDAVDAGPRRRGPPAPPPAAPATAPRARRCAARRGSRCRNRRSGWRTRRSRSSRSRCARFRARRRRARSRSGGTRRLRASLVTTKKIGRR